MSQCGLEEKHSRIKNHESNTLVVKLSVFEIELSKQIKKAVFIMNISTEHYVITGVDLCIQSILITQQAAKQLYHHHF